jgi:hypothetical protein
MSEQVKIGQILDASAQRDAVHVALAPVVCGKSLYPAQDVGIIGTDPKTGLKIVGVSKEPIGIIDPFLKDDANEGQIVYLFLYPNTITSLRHEWTHKAFEPGEYEVARAWIEDFAKDKYISVDELISEASIGGEVCFGTGWYEGDPGGEFWENLEIVAGKKIPGSVRENTSFRCSC